MAGINLSEENIINVNLTPESTIQTDLTPDSAIKTEVPDINYIPGYKVAEEERRSNELERQTYYEEIQRKVNNGEFNGEQGPQGPAGKDGKDGVLTFEEFTEEQKASLKGDKGDKGDTGPQGPKGEKGDTGSTGPQGIQGVQGPRGLQGEKGDKGDTGNTGATGPQGEKGERGEQGIQGPKGDTGATGPQGPAGKDGTNGTNGKDGVDGKDGVTPTLKVGTTTTGEAGTNANVTMNQNGTEYTLNFTIPKGEDGTGGSGEDAVGEKYIVNNVAKGEIFNDYEHNVATGEYSHAEGSYTTASGVNSHAEGEGATASFLTSLTLKIGEVEKDSKGIEKNLTTTTITVPSALISLDDIADSYSYGCLIEINRSFSVPIDKIEIIDKSSSLGFDSGKIKITLLNNQARNISSGQEITNVYLGIADGDASHTEGFRNSAIGHYSHAEGEVTIAVGEGSHSEGKNTKAIADASHTEGDKARAEGYASHAEGIETVASGSDSHAEGYATKATNNDAHSEGYNTQANGRRSHAEGHSSRADGTNAHAEGEGTVATEKNQHTQGKYNYLDANGKAGNYAHIIGNGESDTKRSNAYTVDWSGNGWYAGGLTVNGDKEVATKEEVEALFNSITNGNEVSY